jgi:hypothetical protein
MARYVDAEALESELFRDGIAGIFLNYPRRIKFTIGEIRGMLNNKRIAPTVDVVPRSEVEKAKQEVAKEIFGELLGFTSSGIRWLKEMINETEDEEYKVHFMGRLGELCNFETVLTEKQKKYIGE